jgi:hypothetical protein
LGTESFQRGFREQGGFRENRENSGRGSGVGNSDNEKKGSSLKLPEKLPDLSLKLPGKKLPNLRENSERKQRE